MILVAVVLALLICAGCSSVKYVPVESVRTEYRDRDVERIVTDTVRDTRFVWISGDTVIDIREKYNVRRVEVHDTCYIERTDSIEAPYPVERELTRWQQTKMDFGGIAIGGLIAAIGLSVGWLIIKLKK